MTAPGEGTDKGPGKGKSGGKRCRPPVWLTAAEEAAAGRGKGKGPDGKGGLGWRSLVPVNLGTGSGSSSSHMEEIRQGDRI